MTSTPVLQLTQVSKIFGSHDRMVQALSPLDLTVQRGEFVCFLGASGCGKSTLLSIVAGLETSSTGSVIVNGAPVRGPGIDRVMMFQDAALFPWLTVQGNVEFALKQVGMGRRERADVAREWIERVHLRGFENSAVHQLSGGMRQRVALARSLAVDPAILLMDEPFGALDALTRDRLHLELENLWSATRKTILFVTHNVREAVALGDRVLVFSPRPGRIVGEFGIDLPRPRSLEDVTVVRETAKVMDVLRGALEKSNDEV
ncbi:MAG: ABC transporter ATP-binding protein [Chloroflexi bacterium]|nr:ABC transporter ATP-binding protein [Chloroflexota bacterium]